MEKLANIGNLYVYRRVSTIMQEQNGESLDVQMKKCKGYAESVLGKEVARVFTDVGVSGTRRFRTRLGSGKLCEILEKGDVIVASKLDRMFRSAIDCLETARDFSARNIRIILLDIGELSNDSAMGKLMMTISAAFAEVERDRLQERVREVKKEQRLQGKFLGGKRRFGYNITKQGYEVKNKQEQHIIKQIKTLAQEGMTQRMIAESINPQHNINMNQVHICRLMKRLDAERAVA